MQHRTLILVSLFLALGIAGCDMSEFKSLEEIRKEIKATPFEERDDSIDAWIKSKSFVKVVDLARELLHLWGKPKSWTAPAIERCVEMAITNYGYTVTLDETKALRLAVPYADE